MSGHSKIPDIVAKHMLALRDEIEAEGQCEDCASRSAVVSLLCADLDLALGEDASKGQRAVHLMGLIEETMVVMQESENTPCNVIH